MAIRTTVPQASGLISSPSPSNKPPSSTSQLCTNSVHATSLLSVQYYLLACKPARWSRNGYGPFLNGSSVALAGKPDAAHVKKTNRSRSFLSVQAGFSLNSYYERAPRTLAIAGVVQASEGAGGRDCEDGRNENKEELDGGGTCLFYGTLSNNMTGVTIH